MLFIYSYFKKWVKFSLFSLWNLKIDLLYIFIFLEEEALSNNSCKNFQNPKKVINENDNNSLEYVAN